MCARPPKNKVAGQIRIRRSRRRESYLGYVEGISNIITKNLKQLDVTQRPVHCADKKREAIYIKDEDKWEKEEEKKEITQSNKKGCFYVSADDTRRIINEQISTYTSEKFSALEVAITKLGDQQDRIIRHYDPASAVTARYAIDNVAAAPLVGTAHLWPGSAILHYVPHSFPFPYLNVNVMWNLWFLGDASKSIGPFRYINPKFDLPHGIDKTNKTRAKKAIDRMIAIAVAHGKIAHSRDIVEANLQEIYEFSYELLLEELSQNVMPSTTSS